MRKFENIAQVINYFAECNPARQKSVNFFELDRPAKTGESDFSPNHPHRIWARICVAIRDALAATKDPRARAAFEAHYLRDREAALSKVDIARVLCVSRSHIYRLVDKVMDNLEFELMRRGILPAHHGVTVH